MVTRTTRTYTYGPTLSLPDALPNFLRELQAAPSCPRDRKLTMASRDAVMASRIKLCGRAFEPLLGLDHRARRKPVLTMPVLAERDQVGRCPHCTHDSIELDGAGTVPMDKPRQVAVGEGGLAVGDGVERGRVRKSGG